MKIRKILNPALYIMSMLSFKAKIIFSISILLIILFYPSQKIFISRYNRTDVYTQQLIGLEYIKMIYGLISVVQYHRAYMNSYLNGDKTKIELIKDSEKSFELKYKSLLSYDSHHLNILKSNQNFVKAISEFIVLKLNRVEESNSSIIEDYNNIFNLIRDTILDISQATNFAISSDLRVNYLADMLQDKLLEIYNQSGQLLALFIVTSKSSLIKEQIRVLYSLSSELASLKSILLDNDILTKLPNYQIIQTQTTDVSKKLQEIISFIDYDIIIDRNTSYSIGKLSNSIKEAMYSQEELYRIFLYTYEYIIKDLMGDARRDLIYLILGYISIIALAIYIYIAFYISITDNLKKLQNISKMISSAKGIEELQRVSKKISSEKISIRENIKDEIGQALFAFYTMSSSLDRNISLLKGYQEVIDKSSIVSKTDPRGVITYANDLFCKISGYSRDELLHSPHNIVRHPDVPKKVFKEMWRTIKSNNVWKGVLKNRRKDGSTYIVNATIIPISENESDIIEYVAVRHDITELEKSKEEIKKQRVDLLTGLLNRNQLVEDLSKAIKPILFYINIDDFSGFNDFYGKEISDKTLICLASILDGIKDKKRFRLYKLEADQFILLFEEGYISKDNFQFFFNELIEYIEKEMEKKNKISISITAGVATYYSNEDYQKLILYSNIARKKAKKRHKKFLIFNHNMRKNEDYANNIEWVRKIKDAIAEDRIDCYYQPIFNNRTGLIEKYESLVRIIDRNGEPISPFFFLDIARRAKLYEQISKIIIDKSLDKFRNYPDIEFSINLTVEDILSANITNYIYQKLERYPNPSRIVFEITESQEILDYDIINNFIKYIRSFNAKIAIDDFGSGYANFEHILNIDADYIKIDGSLIKNIEFDENSFIITKAIIKFSKELNRKTITEFIHNKNVFEIVKKLGADYSQGFYLGMPSHDIIS